MPEITEWLEIPHFENYEISNTGRVRRTRPKLQHIKTFPLNDGSIGVKLYGDGRYYQHLVRRLVAAMFCEQRHNLDDSVIHIDGDKTNCYAENLAWRPRWFAWKYTAQFSTQFDKAWQRPVLNIDTGMIFNTICDAGFNDVALWEEILMSTVDGRLAYPGYRYELLSQAEYHRHRHNQL